MSEGGEKTESPTAKRKQKASDEGDVLKSKELSTAIVVLAGCVWLAMAGPALVDAIRALLRESLMFGRADVEDFEPLRPIIAVGLKMGPPLLGLFALVIVASVVSQAGLGPMRFNAKLWAFKGSRINPASGLKRIMGTGGLIELGKAILKVILLGSIGTWLLWSMTQRSLGLVAGNLEGVVADLGATFVTSLLVMAGGLILIAGIDVPIQMIRMLAKLRMSKQEVKDEYKEAEGSPEVKGAIRQRQREMMRRSMRKAVEGAHVVLTNPTHFAVALRYDRGKDQVPVLVAKGRGQTALAIRELAAELNVPVLEYPTLARAVYYTTKEDQEVRDDLYLAIATVLAFVFGLNAQAGGRQPVVLVPETARFDENGEKVKSG